MPHLASDASERARLLEKAVSRWENEGGAVVDGRADPSSKETSPDVSPISNAEFVQLQMFHEIMGRCALGKSSYFLTNNAKEAVKPCRKLFSPTGPISPLQKKPARPNGPNRC